MKIQQQLKALMSAYDYEAFILSCAKHKIEPNVDLAIMFNEGVISELKRENNYE